MDDQDLAEFVGKVSQWMETTTEYRRTLCAKIDLLFKKLGELPCERRSYLAAQVKYLWGAVFVVFILVVTAYFNHFMK